jgi:glucokinase
MREHGSLAAEVIGAARIGDPTALQIIASVGSRLGQWLASLAPIFLPDRIALCGGVAEAGAPLLAACRARFEELVAPDYAECTLVLGRFGGLAGAIGSASPFLVREA